MLTEVRTEKWCCNGVEFRVGDKVNIVRLEVDDAPNGMGDGVMWDNAWSDTSDERGTITSGMSTYLTLGGVYEIDFIDETGVYFVVDEIHKNEYGWPLTALENLSRKV